MGSARNGAAATSQQIADLKERIDRSEGGVSGRAGQVIETRSQQSNSYQLIGIILVLVSIVSGLIIAYAAGQ